MSRLFYSDTQTAAFGTLGLEVSCFYKCGNVCLGTNPILVLADKKTSPPVRIKVEDKKILTKKKNIFPQKIIF